jgi:hypothetical protein
MQTLPAWCPPPAGERETGMELIGFKAYRRGFVGCLADGRCYVYFTFSRGVFKAIQHYPQTQFESLAHFTTSLHKFLPLRFFLRRPFPLPSLESKALEALGRHLAASLPPEAFLSLDTIDLRHAEDVKEPSHTIRRSAEALPPASEPHLTQSFRPCREEAAPWG